jgi:hypothetical protein
MRTIYTDQETEKILEKIKDNNPQFNLSSFIKGRLSEYNGEEEEMSVSKLDHDITQAELQLQQAQEQLNYAKDRKIQFLATKKMHEEKQLNEAKILTSTILKYYAIPETQAFQIAEEYIESGTRISITKFLDDKGFKEKFRK